LEKPALHVEYYDICVQATMNLDMGFVILLINNWCRTAWQRLCPRMFQYCRGLRGPILPMTLSDFEGHFCCLKPFWFPYLGKCIIMPHHLHAVHRLGRLLQMSHVAWSVCLCVKRNSERPIRLNSTQLVIGYYRPLKWPIE